VDLRPQYNYEGGTLATYIGARINRGLALWEDKVLIATGDCRLIALNRKSGQKVWETVSCDKSELCM
jgi:outer membrane protein assembly factor BamB